MAKTIDISVKDNLGNGVYGTKGYIGTKSGERLYDAKKGGISDHNGAFKLEVGTMPLISQYIWVKDPNSDYESKQLYRSSKKSTYLFEKPKSVQEVQEVIVVGKKQTPKADKPKKNLFPLYLFGSIGVLIIGFIIYKKNKR